MKKKTPVYKIGDRVIKFNGDIGIVTDVLVWFSYELDGDGKPYRIDEIRRKATTKEIDSKNRGGF